MPSFLLKVLESLLGIVEFLLSLVLDLDGSEIFLMSGQLGLLSSSKSGLGLLNSLLSKLDRVVSSGVISSGHGPGLNFDTSDVADEDESDQDD